MWCFFSLHAYTGVLVCFSFQFVHTKNPENNHHILTSIPAWAGKVGMKINDLTGEVIEESSDNLALAKRELNELTLFEPWLEAKEKLLTAKEQFDMVDKPFRKLIRELFDKFQIKSISNDYISISYRNGYVKESWDDEKLEQFIVSHGAKPSDFKTTKWVEGGLQMKYKED